MPSAWPFLSSPQLEHEHGDDQPSSIRKTGQHSKDGGALWWRRLDLRLISWNTAALALYLVQATVVFSSCRSKRINILTDTLYLLASVILWARISTTQSVPFRRFCLGSLDWPIPHVGLQFPWSLGLGMSLNALYFPASGWRQYSPHMPCHSTRPQLACPLKPKAMIHSPKAQQSHFAKIPIRKHTHIRNVFGPQVFILVKRFPRPTWILHRNSVCQQLLRHTF